MTIQKNGNFFGLKLSCDSRFQRIFTACACVFRVITLVGSSQHNFFENKNACSKRTLKPIVATHPNSGKLEKAIKCCRYHNIALGIHNAEHYN